MWQKPLKSGCFVCPLQILLDGPGTLKYSNFCLSKAEGEHLEEFFLMVMSEDGGVQEGSENAHGRNTKKMVRGKEAAARPALIFQAEQLY